MSAEKTNKAESLRLSRLCGLIGLIYWVAAVLRCTTIHESFLGLRKLSSSFSSSSSNELDWPPFRLRLFCAGFISGFLITLKWLRASFFGFRTSDFFQLLPFGLRISTYACRAPLVACMLFSPLHLHKTLHFRLTPVPGLSCDNK